MECSVNDCSGLVKARGLCNMHYQRFMTFGDVGSAKRAKPHKILPNEICIIENCNKPVRSIGLCLSHYKKQLRHNDPLFQRPARGICDEISCNNPHQAKGKCAFHYGKQLRNKNKDRYNETVRIRRAKNPIQFINYYNSYRANKLKNAVALISKKDLRRLKNSPCFYCNSKENLEIDHIIPLSRGGRHAIGNLISACRSCNRSKNNRLITEWKLSTH